MLGKRRVLNRYHQVITRTTNGIPSRARLIMMCKKWGEAEHDKKTCKGLLLPLANVNLGSLGLLKKKSPVTLSKEKY